MTYRISWLYYWPLALGFPGYMTYLWYSGYPGYAVYLYWLGYPGYAVYLCWLGYPGCVTNLWHSGYPGYPLTYDVQDVLVMSVICDQDILAMPSPIVPRISGLWHQFKFDGTQDILSMWSIYGTQNILAMTSDWLMAPRISWLCHWLVVFRISCLCQSSMVIRIFWFQIMLLTSGTQGILAMPWWSRCPGHYSGYPGYATQLWHSGYPAYVTHLWWWGHPGYSPDLNPIEHLWTTLKWKLNEYDNPPSGVWELWDRVVEKWGEITEEDCQRLIRSMPRRLKAVVSAHGGHTKY